jgi:hypothetical protein
MELLGDDKAPYLISRCFPESMTHVMSGIVMPVSAILVAVKFQTYDECMLQWTRHKDNRPITIFRIPLGGISKTAP